MGIDREFIDEIGRRAPCLTARDRIVLFGSAASGPMTPDSDIDLMILEPAPGDVRAQRTAIRHALFGLDRAFDPIVLPTEKFERGKHVIGTIAWPAAQTGKVIDEAA